MKYHVKVFLLFIILSVFMISSKTNADIPLQGKLIVVDAGHGGLDPGTIYKNIYEKDINLKISKYLEEELNALGSSVVLTRSSDSDLSNGVKSHRKRTDFDNRIKIINDKNVDMYISIHLNYLSDSKYRGAQVFYNKNNKTLAEVIQKHLNEYLGSNRKIKKIPSSTYMYKNLKTKGVLIECGFLSNPTERNMLITDDYQKKIAKAISASIIKYYYK